MRRSSSLLLAAVSVAGAALIVRYGRRRTDPEPSGILGPDAVRALYDRMAPLYDVVAAGYDRVGAGRFHRDAVAALHLAPGDTAVDLACGTGANLAALVRAVGPGGRVIGVDLSPGMLARARSRVEREGWANVELVEADVREFTFPVGIGGVVSTYGLEMVVEHDGVIARAAHALRPGGRIAVGGLRRPESWPEWAVRIGAWVNQPFGMSRAYEQVQPWRSLARHAADVQYEERLLGAVYLTSGSKPPVLP